MRLDDVFYFINTVTKHKQQQCDCFRSELWLFRFCIMISEIKLYDINKSTVTKAQNYYISNYYIQNIFHTFLLDFYLESFVFWGEISSSSSRKWSSKSENSSWCEDKLNSFTGICCQTNEPFNDRTDKDNSCISPLQRLVFSATFTSTTFTTTTKKQCPPSVCLCYTMNEWTLI